ncbi:hypothetical protein Tco_0602590 [Tanacetum coccineum]
MDDPDITMEEYIRLEEEKARRRGQVYNWETATYEVSYDFENEFSAIIYNDALATDHKISFEPQNFPKCLNGSAQAKLFESRIRFFARLIEEFGFALHRVADEVILFLIYRVMSPSKRKFRWGIMRSTGIKRYIDPISGCKIRVQTIRGSTTTPRRTKGNKSTYSLHTRGNMNGGLMRLLTDSALSLRLVIKPTSLTMDRPGGS